MMREVKTSFNESASPDDISQLFFGGGRVIVLGAGFKCFRGIKSYVRIVELEYDKKMNCF